MSKKKLLLVGGIVIGSYIYIVTIFYLLWNPVHAAITDGIQGRYFLTLVPFGYLAGVQIVAMIKHRKWSVPLWILMPLYAIMALTIGYSVIARYFL